MDSLVLNDFKLRQCPVDTWTTREQLCLSSAVLQTGDQNWVAVSRSVRQVTVETDRPPDWYSTKNCAVQYAKLLEHVDTPKRKREKGEGLQNETPGEIVTKALSKKRVEELQGILEEEKVMYNQLRKEILQLETSQLDSKRLDQYWDEIIREQEWEDEKAAKLQEFHKEREEKIKNFQAATKLYSTKSQVLTTPRKNFVPVKPLPVQSVKKPTNSTAEFSNSEEMKTEQPLTEETQNTASDRSPIGQESPLKSVCEESVNEIEQIVENFPVVKEEENLKPSTDVLEEMKCDTSFETNIPLDYTSNLNVELKEQDHDIIPEDERKLLDVTDLAVFKTEPLQKDDEDILEEPDLLPPKEGNDPEESEPHKDELESEEEKGSEELKESVFELEKESEKGVVESDAKEDENEMDEEEDSLMNKEDAKREKEAKKKGKRQKTHLFGFSKDESKPSKLLDVSELADKKEADDSDCEAESQKNAISSVDAFSILPFDFSNEKDVSKRLKKEARDEYEFEDDASRESTDVNRTFRDYMYRGERRKFSLGDSVSSPVVSESTPSSPASTSYGDDPEAEKLHRSWKRSIMLIWNDIAAHKNASIFLKPITEDKVPGYHSIVFRPIDLMTIKRNIENGTIRSTGDFQRDVMLMFLNAKMYNTSEHNVYRMAEHMMNDAVETIEEFINAQMLAKVVESPQKTLRRETRESSAKRVGDDKRKRDDREEKGVKRRKL